MWEGIDNWNILDLDMILQAENYITSCLGKKFALNVMGN